MISNEYQIGAFRGRMLVQRRGKVGGAKSVFVKISGIKNELVFPTLGGMIKNPFKQGGKMFAGDLCEYRTDDNGRKPEIYLLKTFLVERADGTTVKIVKDDYKHKPCVGDVIGVAPVKVGGAVTSKATIISVAVGKEGSTNVWVLTMSDTFTASKGNVLVEADSDGNMLVKNVNAVIDCDIDLLNAPATDDNDFDGARYMYTPSLGGLMYLNKMSPMPACVKELNQSKINGWFQIQSV